LNFGLPADGIGLTKVSDGREFGPRTIFLVHRSKSFPTISGVFRYHVWNGSDIRGKFEMTEEKPGKIEQRAYEIWDREGRPHGKALEHWHQAVAEVAREEEQAAKARAEKAKKKESKPKKAGSKPTAAAKTSGAKPAAKTKSAAKPKKTAAKTKG
jgi:hypothetical protein